MIKVEAEMNLARPAFSFALFPLFTAHECPHRRVD